ncbi:CRISPR-associated helicase/endonuclease Cas3 [Salmonella enterica]|nr:CRISPR-associated helicase/endonuclease Cas3 [Salmonella enterica]
MNPFKYIGHYWGKSSKKEKDQNDIHLLIFHCLDVVAVANCWWEHSVVLQKALSRDQTLPDEKIKAWMMFFIALHDVGKFDIRFQYKSPASWLMLNPTNILNKYPAPQTCYEYNHGAAGLHWFNRDYVGASSSDDFFFFFDATEHPYESWFPWIEAVTGHHGFVLRFPDQDKSRWEMPSSLSSFAEQDKQARHEWISVLEVLFLAPAGVSINDNPPKCSPMVAGFCSISDWLGSWTTTDTFIFNHREPLNLQELRSYFTERHKDAKQVLKRSGLLSKSHCYAGVQKLLDMGCQPRQLQVLVDELPVTPGLTLIEAPTGSGKTETALAYAWKLIDQQWADSIIFALPTQATANAMLSRMELLASQIFISPNLVLAHGNSRFNSLFQSLKSHITAEQGVEEALVQCCQWLSQSNKKVFLGQIGVCTIDQILISVLPVKHRFIRSLGIGRSVLIVDEVHAYDTYMNGLLEAVLKAQVDAGGSAILLSATLPMKQKQALLDTYGKITTLMENNASYPLINWRSTKEAQQFDLTAQPEQLPSRFSVSLEPFYFAEMLPDTAMLERMLAAAYAGAQVCLICNLVDVAQLCCQRLQDMNIADLQIELFHARYTLLDRQVKESRVISYFGKQGTRKSGRILVSTQVTEQSLDVDFDWLITQHCPADLLFQRMGRLHRHDRKYRPAGFESPLITILLPDDIGYGKHEKIYSNIRIMWRTQQHIEQLGEQPLIFPDAYRQWLDVIYDDKPMAEPDWVISGMEEFDDVQRTKRFNARQVLQWAEEYSLKDNDETIRAVTRDGEMSLPLLPYILTPQGKQLLNGEIYEQLSEDKQFEALALNRVNVPGRWRSDFPDFSDEEGLLWLEGHQIDGSWIWRGSRCVITYTQHTGMVRTTPVNPK